jgi:hypothetical protein
MTVTRIPLESSHPVPKVRRGQPAKYPFETMQPGHSFAVPIGNATLQQVRNRLQQSLHGLRHRGRVDGKFITKRDGDVVRCWRVR